MFESTVKLSSRTDASFYDAEAFEMHNQAVLYSAKMGAKNRTTEEYCTWMGKKHSSKNAALVYFRLFFVFFHNCSGHENRVRWLGKLWLEQQENSTTDLYQLAWTDCVYTDSKWCEAYYSWGQYGFSSQDEPIKKMTLCLVKQKHT